MDGSEKSKRVVWSPKALVDLAENYQYTASYWGIEQAERYADFIAAHAQHAAENPNTGKVINGLAEPAEARALFIRWKRARHGHLLVYISTDYGAYVLRLLHTSRDTDRILS